jgi:4-hydroxy-tetrahydrodipicolinate reductase
VNIAIIGYGRMGRLIEAEALDRGHLISAVVDPLAGGTLSRSGVLIRAGIDQLDGNLPEGSPPGAGRTDAAIEFTRPDTAPDNIKALAERHIPVVTGTTGWLDRLDEVKRAVEAARSALLWASNFSLGVNLFYRIASYAAALADPFPEYDVGGWEAHHNKKADSPSGTAKTLVELVLSRMARKKRAAWDSLSGPPAPDTIHFPSLRVGAMPGTHSLIFDSPADTITITHSARNREGFASGALRAAEWLAASGTARRGIFTMDDVMNDTLEAILKGVR